MLVSALEWPEHEQTFTTLIGALEHLWSKRSSSAGRVYWNQDHNTGWLNNPATATSLAALIAARTVEAKDLLDEVPPTTSWGLPCRWVQVVQPI